MAQQPFVSLKDVEGGHGNHSFHVTPSFNRNSPLLPQSDALFGDESMAYIPQNQSNNNFANADDTFSPLPMLNPVQDIEMSNSGNSLPSRNLVNSQITPDYNLPTMQGYGSTTHPQPWMLGGLSASSAELPAQPLGMNRRYFDQTPHLQPPSQDFNSGKFSLGPMANSVVDTNINTQTNNNTPWPVSPNRPRLSKVSSARKSTSRAYRGPKKSTYSGGNSTPNKYSNLEKTPSFQRQQPYGNAGSLFPFSIDQQVGQGREPQHGFAILKESMQRLPEDLQSKGADLLDEFQRRFKDLFIEDVNQKFDTPPRPVETLATSIDSSQDSHSISEVFESETESTSESSKPPETDGGSEEFVSVETEKVHHPCPNCGSKAIHYCERKDCPYTTHLFTDWKRHLEGDKHWPKERYMCLDCCVSSPTTDGNGNPTCKYCHLPWATLGMNAQAHYLRCASAQKKGKTFGRKDHLVTHLRSEHQSNTSNVNQIASTWKYPINCKRPDQCGFCGKRFESWDARLKHIADHFSREGLDMSTWRLPRPEPKPKPKECRPKAPGYSCPKDDSDDDDDYDDSHDSSRKTPTPHNPTHTKPCSQNQQRSSNTTQNSASTVQGQYWRWHTSDDVVLSKQRISSQISQTGSSPALQRYLNDSEKNIAALLNLQDLNPLDANDVDTVLTTLEDATLQGNLTSYQASGNLDHLDADYKTAAKPTRMNIDPKFAALDNNARSWTKNTSRKSRETQRIVLDYLPGCKEFLQARQFLIKIAGFLRHGVLWMDHKVDLSMLLSLIEISFTSVSDYQKGGLTKNRVLQFWTCYITYHFPPSPDSSFPCRPEVLRVSIWETDGCLSVTVTSDKPLKKNVSRKRGRPCIKKTCDETVASSMKPACTYEGQRSPSASNLTSKVYHVPGCDLGRHEKRTFRAWKCRVESCKYHGHGWPPENEKVTHYRRHYCDNFSSKAHTIVDSNLRYAIRQSFERRLHKRDNLPKNEIRNFWNTMSGVAGALKCIHGIHDTDTEYGIKGRLPQLLQELHQDIKPLNILVRSGKFCSSTFEGKSGIGNLALSHLMSASDKSTVALDYKKHKVLKPRDTNELFKYSATAVDWNIKLEMTKDPWFSLCWVIQELALAPDALVDRGRGSLIANTHEYGTPNSCHGKHYTTQAKPVVNSLPLVPGTQLIYSPQISRKAHLICLDYLARCISTKANTVKSKKFFQHSNLNILGSQRAYVKNFEESKEWPFVYYKWGGYCYQNKHGSIAGFSHLLYPSSEQREDEDILDHTICVFGRRLGSTTSDNVLRGGGMCGPEDELIIPRPVSCQSAVIKTGSAVRDTESCVKKTVLNGPSEIVLPVPVADAESLVYNQRLDKLGRAIQMEKVDASPIYSRLDAKVDMVLAHGLNGHPEKTWTAITGVFWPTEFLPASLNFTQANILVYGYNANVTAFSDKYERADMIYDHAQTLLQNICPLQVDKHRSLWKNDMILDNDCKAKFSKEEAYAASICGQEVQLMPDVCLDNPFQLSTGDRNWRFLEAAQVHKDLNAYSSANQQRKGRKSFMQTCDSVKGLRKHRHTLAHDTTMVWNYSPVSVVEKSFNRAELFSRHSSTVPGTTSSPKKVRERPLQCSEQPSCFCDELLPLSRPSRLQEHSIWRRRRKERVRHHYPHHPCQAERPSNLPVSSLVFTNNSVADTLLSNYDLFCPTGYIRAPNFSSISRWHSAFTSFRPSSGPHIFVSEPTTNPSLDEILAGRMVPHDTFSIKIQVQFLGKSPLRRAQKSREIK